MGKIIPKLLKLAGITLVVLVVCLYAYLRQVEKNYFIELLPADVEISKTILIRDSTNIFERLFMTVFWRSESCGAAIFELSGGTKEGIKKHGIAFFEKATYSRGVFDGRPKEYKSWQESPLPASWTKDVENYGLWSGLLCADIETTSLATKLRSAAKGNGSFFTTPADHRGGPLVVIPDAGIVIYSYWN
jgi:hypothetical protein